MVARSPLPTSATLLATLTMESVADPAVWIDRDADAAGSAAANNHLGGSTGDAIMMRTEAAPTLAQRSVEAWRRCAELLPWPSAWTIWRCCWRSPIRSLAALTFISPIGYAVIYTLFLKAGDTAEHRDGGAAGAAPPRLGWTAVTGLASIRARCCCF
ncbi:MAG: hypothetical protein R3F36_03600 [Candidatus Competibacteraceae bacterium]